MNRPLLRRDQLRDQQINIIDVLCERKSALIVLPMAGGKTGAVLTLCLDLLNRLEARRILVVAPLRVARDVWPAEVAAWEHTRFISVGLAIGDPKKREAAVDSAPEITVTNFENLVWLHRYCGRDWPFDVTVIDESSALKSGKKRTSSTKRKGADGKVRVTKGGNLTRFGALAKARSRIDRMILLTGTPAPNGVHDLWGQIYLIDQGKRLGATMTAFEDRWFVKDPYSYDVRPRPGAEEEIMSRIADVMFSFPPPADLPEPVFVPIRVQLPHDVLCEYRNFKRKLVSEIHDVEAVSQGVLTNKLLQFCIAEGTPVLTRYGWTAIEKVKPGDEVWDGIEWVRTKGSVFNGCREVTECFGVVMTSNHLVLTNAGWKSAEEISKNGYASEGFNRAEVRLPRGYSATRHEPRGNQEGHLAVPLRLRSGGGSREPEPTVETSTEREVVRMQARGGSVGRPRGAYDDWFPPVADLDADEGQMLGPREQRLSQLRRQGNYHAGRMEDIVPEVLGRCERRLRGPSEHRPDRQHGSVLQGERPLGYCQTTASEHEGQPNHPHTLGADERCGGCRKSRFEIRHAFPSRQARRVAGNLVPPRVKVFDLIACGPRNRYVVNGHLGPIIVHNCNGSMYREDRSIAHIHDAKLDALTSLVEEAAGDPLLVFYSFKFDLDRIMKRFPYAVKLGDENVVKDWNAGKIKLLLAHPKSCAHGLNLQFGGHLAVWYGLTWSLELYLQANARLPRPGQKWPVAIYQIIAEGTDDQRLLDVLSDRNSTQEAIAASVRRAIVDAQTD